MSFRSEAEVVPGFLSRFRNSILVFLAVLGPGFITAVVDNDFRRNLYLLTGRRPLGLSAALDAAPHHRRPDRHAGNVLPAWAR